MSAVATLWGRLKARTIAGAALWPSSDWFGAWLNSRGALAGVAGPNDRIVTPSEALSIAAVYRAVSLLSDIPASLPISIVERPESGGARAVASSDASKALALMEHSDKELALFAAALLGNGYVEIVRNGRGGAEELRALPTPRVYLAMDDRGRLFYVVMPDPTVGEEEQRAIPESDVIHVRFRVSGRNRYVGVPPLASVNPALGAVLNARDMQAAFFANSAHPSIVLATDQALMQKTVDQLEQKWIEMTTGAHRGATPILTHGLKLIPGQHYISAVDADLVNALKFGVQEVSRAYGIPLSLLSEVRDTTYASAVEEGRALIYSTLQPWCTRIAAAFSQKLLTPAERVRGVGIEFDLMQLRLGDGKDRAEYMRTMVAAGVMTPNEARNLSGLPDIPGGDTLVLPLNSAPLETWLKEPLREGRNEPV